MSSTTNTTWAARKRSRYRVSTVHGASERNEGAFTIDGMEISWRRERPARPPVCIPTPAGYQEINYQAGNASAESPRGGLVYNLVTRTGSNVFRGAFTFSGANDDLQWNNVTPALRSDLLAGVPPKALAANPSFIARARRFCCIFNVAGNVSGPIVRDRLWFSATQRLRSAESACCRQL